MYAGLLHGTDQRAIQHVNVKFGFIGKEWKMPNLVVEQQNSKLYLVIWVISVKWRICVVYDFKYIFHHYCGGSKNVEVVILSK
jgi:hypothetical protein